MSYQIAIIVKANDRLSTIFNTIGSDGRQNNQTSQLGWWIPTRGEDLPPEDYTMVLCDVNLTPVVSQSNLRMLQTTLKQGLYTKIGGRIDEPYNKLSKNDPQKHEATWKFGSGGDLVSVTQTSDSVLTDAEYFVPIKSLSKI